MIYDCTKTLEVIKNEVKEFKKDGLNKSLLIISAGDKPDSQSYIKSKEKMASELGVNLDVAHINHTFFTTTNNNKKELYSDRIEELINKAQHLYDGIMIQVPLPLYRDKVYTTKLTKDLINLIPERKDVDCLTDINLGKLFNNEDNCKAPCTPTGIMKLFEVNNCDLDGKDVLIINRSEAVGKSLAHLLINKNATVTIAHSHTKDLATKIIRADIIIVAVGIKDFIPYNLLKEMDNLNKEKIIIDVGINKVDDTSKKICGDVEYNCTDHIDKLKELKNIYITPVPKGIGPLTVASLFYNLYK